MGFPEGTAERPCTHQGWEEACRAQKRSYGTGQGRGACGAHTESTGWGGVSREMLVEELRGAAGPNGRKCLPIGLTGEERAVEGTVPSREQPKTDSKPLGSVSHTQNFLLVGR